MYLDEAVGGYVRGSRGRPGLKESPIVAIPEDGHVKRMSVSQQTAYDERDKRKVEEEADENIALMMDYFKGC